MTEVTSFSLFMTSSYSLLSNSSSVPGSILAESVTYLLLQYITCSVNSKWWHYLKWPCTEGHRDVTIQSVCWRSALSWPEASKNPFLFLSNCSGNGITVWNQIQPHFSFLDSFIVRAVLYLSSWMYSPFLCKTSEWIF